MLRSILCCIVLLPAVFLMGCGGEGATDRKTTHEVTGTVTMAGGSVPDAIITFAPQEGQPVATGRTDSSGKYSLTTYESGDGAVAGSYAVLVTKAGGGTASGPSEQEAHEAIASGKPPAAGHAGPGSSGGEKGGSSSMLPEKYQSTSSTPLTATVKADQANIIDFQLEP